MDFGGPEVLGLHRVSMPAPGEREILVEVEAATVNPADIFLRSGGLQSMMNGTPPYYGGLELAGTIVAAGSNSRWKIGEKVAGLTLFLPSGRGAHCRHVVINDDSAATIPSSLNMAQAAAVPMSGITARLAIDKARPYGRRVAITGAIGSVGSIALRLALLEGLEPIAVVRRSQFDRARKLGAKHIVDAEDMVSQMRGIAPSGVDAVIDCALMMQANEAVIRDGGFFGGLRPFDFTFGRGIVTGLIGMPEYLREQVKLQELLTLAGKGEFPISIASVFPPAQAAEAHRLLEKGGLGGRISLDFSGIS